MARKVFYSFHYQPDSWRVSQVRNIGAIEDNKPAKDNDWETVTKGGDKAIEKWIDEQMSGRSCVVVLIGSATANRKWINHEIKKAWADGKGLVGVHIHGLKNSEGKTCAKGANPFDGFTLTSERAW
ncbi:MAG: TIR domain-containing protein [Burkholderiaceae bacterium]|nr:TIR domain-containing protein [Burkholderiaceae bacterium]